MRDIRFRGKRIDNGEWVYGWYIRYEHMGVVKHIIATSYAQIYVHSYEVDPETVGQYTGRQDMKGKEVYENSIIKFRRFEFEYIGVVCFEKGCFIVKWESVVGAYGEKATHSVYLKDAANIEIIGTRYDNPELLGEVRE